MAEPLTAIPIIVDVARGESPSPGLNGRIQERYDYLPLTSSRRSRRRRIMGL
jgi:hypothetical protein